jgi:excisionase family DNA binding protein
MTRKKMSLQDPALEPQFYRPKTAARILGVSPSFLYKRLYGGKLRTARLGKAILIPRAELERLSVEALSGGDGQQ